MTGTTTLAVINIQNFADQPSKRFYVRLTLNYLDILLYRL